MTLRDIEARIRDGKDPLAPFRVEPVVDKTACIVCQAPRESFQPVERFESPRTGTTSIRLECPRQCSAVWA